MPRVFIGIILPEHIQARIFHGIENLSKRKLSAGKFIEKENLHLNLKFLGELTEEEIDKLKKNLHKIKFEKFSASIGKIGAFPHMKHIRILWLEFLSDENKATKLYKEVNSVVKIKEKEEFVPHITLGRIKSIKDKKKFVDELKKLNFRNLNFEVNEFFLVKSELTEKGSIYKVIERFALK